MADVHLDSPLAGLAGSGIPEHVWKDCTRRAFANAIDLAMTEDVDFVLVAGDLYDGDWKDFNTGLFFAAQMRRLARPCFMVLGNHDAASVITRRLHLPPNVHVFPTDKAGVVELPGLGVAIHGHSFAGRAVPHDLSAGYESARPGLLNIGILHTSADDPGEHATYAPTTVSALALKGYDYWALGHIHDRRVLHEDPFVVFPGNLQGRHVRETGSKGCTLVEVREGRITLAHRDTDVLRWAQAQAAMDGADSLAEALARVGLALQEAHRGADGLPMIVRLTLEGETPLHAQFVADPAQLAAECRQIAENLGAELYLESVRLDTRPPKAHAPADADLAKLREAFEAALTDPDIAARLLGDMRTLSSALPKLPGRASFVVPQTPEDLAGLLGDAWALASHRLRQ